MTKDTKLAIEKLLGEKKQYHEGEKPYPLSDFYIDKGYNSCYDTALERLSKAEVSEEEIDKFIDDFIMKDTGALAQALKKEFILFKRGGG